MLTPGHHEPFNSGRMVHVPLTAEMIRDRVHIMEPIVLENISFQIDVEALKNKLHIKGEGNHTKELEELVEEAHSVGKPKALYKVSFIESKGDDYVVVDGVTLTSRVLRVNLEKAHRVFSYVATCGMELEEWGNHISDVLRRYWAETIKELALRLAREAMEEYLVEHHRPGSISRMSPGSLTDWPIQEQRSLFKILGNTEDFIGVRLTESLFMIPTKSVSGILFPTEWGFESCQLCPREQCPGRRAAYDKDLYERRYRK